MTTHPDAPGTCQRCGGKCQPHLPTCRRCKQAMEQVFSSEHLTPAVNVETGEVARYVCREHHDQPVTWRGQGCTTCADEIAEARRLRRRKPRPQPETEPLVLT